MPYATTQKDTEKRLQRIAAMRGAIDTTDQHRAVYHVNRDEVVLSIEDWEAIKDGVASLQALLRVAEGRREAAKAAAPKRS